MRASGRLIGLFSFDVGYEIDLEHARRCTTQGESGELERRRAAPTYLRYATPPLRLPLGRLNVRLGDATVEATASAIVHEFGAMTMMLEMPLECDIETLPALTARLTGAGPLEDAARALCEQLFERLAPAVTSPSLNSLVEDYYVIQLEDLEPPATVAGLLAAARGTLASALRCEPVPLSDAEVDEVFRTAVSYYPDDLIVTDWNVALIVDRSFFDAVQVLEYLNVQLLELRYFDALLDKRVAATYALTAAPRRRFALAARPHRRAIDELAAIRLEVATIFERIHNALKLSGDLYLAKVYARTADRLALRAWEDSVDRKLDVLQQMYEVLVQRVATARAELLELTIVILILVELVARL